MLEIELIFSQIISHIFNDFVKAKSSCLEVYFEENRFEKWCKIYEKTLSAETIIKKQVKLQIIFKDKFLRKEIISYFGSSFAAEKLIVQDD